MPLIERSVLTKELKNNPKRPPKLTQSPLQDNLVQLAKLESGLTPGILFQRWQKVKPYYIDDISPSRKDAENTYIHYKLTYTSHSKKVIQADYEALRKAINRAYQYHSKPAK